MINTQRIINSLQGLLDDLEGLLKHLRQYPELHSKCSSSISEITSKIDELKQCQGRGQKSFEDAIST